jgi:hypothetical protein
VAGMKRCPFCGYEPILATRYNGKYHEVYCGNFFGCPVTPCTRLFDTEEEAIEAWNWRAEDGK